MFETRVTKGLGIEHPIIQGGMMWISTSELACAVSNAGGLGIITALSYDDPEDLDDELKKAKSMTDKPFGVNITLLPTLKPINYDAYIDVIIKNNIKIVETAGRNPEKYIKRFKEADIKVIHKCVSLKHAKKAEELGCDFISIDGFECAGHPGEDDITSLILIPLVSDVLRIPIIASGGFGDARGLVAALALGAEAINMGTRFMVTREAPLHENIKQKMVDATERDTLLVLRSLKNTARSFKNALAEKVVGMEKDGAGLFELAPLISGLKGKESLQTGDVDNALLASGQIMGLIKDIPTVEELIHGIIADAHSLINQKLISYCRA